MTLPFSRNTNLQQWSGDGETGLMRKVLTTAGCSTGSIFIRSASISLPLLEYMSCKEVTQTTVIDLKVEFYLSFSSFFLAFLLLHFSFLICHFSVFLFSSVPSSSPVQLLSSLLTFHLNPLHCVFLEFCPYLSFSLPTSYLLLSFD